MNTVALLISVLTQTGKVEAPTLELYQEHFVVRTKIDVWRAPLQIVEPEPKLAVMFRRGESYAVWDERGLTVRNGTKSASTLLPDVPTSPKAFSREEILKNAEAIQSGRRTREASALSGALRFGQESYFLVRWEEKGKPWAEALYSVDMAGEGLKPKFLGRFEGLSTAYKPIDDRLILLGDKPTCVTKGDQVWGVSSYDPKDQSFSFRPQGGQLLSYMPKSKETGLFIEKTSYGTTVGGEVNLITGERKIYYEGRANARFLDVERPYLMAITDSKGTRLRAAEVGSEFNIPNGATVRRAGPFVILWTPGERPTSATVYRPDQWTTVATWKR